MHYRFLAKADRTSAGLGPTATFCHFPPTRHDIRGSEQRRRHTCILPLADEIGMLFKIGARVSADHSLQLLDTSVLIVEDFTKGLDDWPVHATSAIHPITTEQRTSLDVRIVPKPFADP